MDYPWLPQAPRVCLSCTSEVLQTKPPTVRMTMLTPLHQERLQDGRNHEEPRGTAMPSFGKPMKTHEHHGKHGLPCKWWVMWVWQPLYTLFILMNSEFGVFEHVLVKTTELPCWLNEVCKAHSDHIVMLLNEKELHNTYWSNWKSTTLNICLKIVWKTFAKKESWSEPWRYQNTCMIIGVIGTGLQSPRTNNFTHLRVEQVGAWPRTTLPWITTSTMRFRCWFMFEALQATTIEKLPTVRTTMLTPLHQKHLPR